MERLSAEDRLMLWPDELWPQDIGALAILDGDSLLDSDGRFRIDEVRRAVEARLHLVPRFRQLLRVPAPGLGGPMWLDDAGFDVANHVRVTSVPPPADEPAVLGTAAQLRRRRLDRSRPLWELWFLTGLPEQRVGMFARMHHAMADGIAGVATLGAFLDASAATTNGSIQSWTPAPPPSDRAQLADNQRRHGSGLRDALVALARPAVTARRMRDAWPMVRSMLSAPPTAGTSLNQTVGPDRTFAIVRGDLEVARQVADRHGAKVNDVLLAITAAGLAQLLRNRGELVDDMAMPVYVPITLRRAQDRENARGNMIGQMLVLLPIGELDPGVRLDRIAAETTRQKSGAHPNLGGMFRSRLARRALLALLQRHPVSVSTADVPGPAHELYFAGAKLVEVFPVLPLIANVTLGVGALSYAGQFNIGVVADGDAVPDLDIFVTAAENEWRAIASLQSQDASTPGS